MNAFSKYVWLIDLLKNGAALTIDEICDEWRNSRFAYNNEPLEKRTLHRWRDSILDLLGIEIRCDAKDQYRYRIVNPELLNDDTVTTWLLNTYSTYDTVMEYRSMTANIMLEPAPSACEYLNTVLEAIKKRHSLVLVYKRFQEPDPREPEEIEPYCVRYFQRRWYAVVRYVSHGGLRTIGLDRVKSLEPTENRYEIPADFNANEYFNDDYGVSNYGTDAPTAILLKVDKDQRPYTDSLPLHHTQEEVEHHDDYSVYRLFMKPTHDLARAIMPYGKHIRVLEPESLRKELHDMARAVAKNNSSRPVKAEHTDENREVVVEAIKRALDRRREENKGLKNS
jgi:hypothetical protein